MYIPPPFREQRACRLEELMRKHPLATVVTLNAEGLQASHVPLLYEAAGARGILHGHLARSNPQARNLRPECEALAIFHGPQAYISPSWYAAKRSTGRVVPTWNYAVVHAYGTIAAYTDPARLRAHVAALTAAREAPYSRWSVDDAPDPYIAGMLEAIVGIDITIARLEGKWKMSQNRPPEDRAGVIEGLLNAGSPECAAVAELVRDCDEEYGTS